MSTDDFYSQLNQHPIKIGEIVLNGKIVEILEKLQMKSEVKGNLNLIVEHLKSISDVSLTYDYSFIREAESILWDYYELLNSFVNLYKTI